MKKATFKTFKENFTKEDIVLMEYINYVFDIEKLVKKFFHITNIKDYEIS